MKELLEAVEKLSLALELLKDAKPFVYRYGERYPDDEEPAQWLKRYAELKKEVRGIGE